jgi:hypothetical protein
MKKHLTDGELRSALDGELDAASLEHLEACADCLARRSSLQSEIETTSSRLAFLARDARQVPGHQKAWALLSQRILINKETSMFKRLFAFPAIRFAAAALVILALVLAFPTTRALAGQLLDLFRVQQVAVVPIDFTGLEQLTGDGELGSQFTNVISNSVNVTSEPGEATPAADAAEASQLAGFTVRQPEGEGPSQIYVTDGGAFTMTIDRQKAQGLLDEAGRSDLILPESVDGAEISVTVPPAVSLAYGDCPKPEADVEEAEGQKSYPDCVIFAQIPSPSVSAPANLDIDKLAQVGLEFTGMTAEEAAAFTSTIDWTSTLVVPIPRNTASYEQVSVDGVTGTLIQHASRDGEPSTFALLWVKDGVVYAISAQGGSSKQAIEMANSLP